MSRCHFIPPYLLARVASVHVDADIARCGHSTLAIDEALRSRRTTPPPVVDAGAPSFAVSGEDAWTIHTADNTASLPGDPVRSAGEPVSGDVAVDEAYAGAKASVSLFREVFGRDSYDGRGAPVIATVHYEKNYDNAFWDGRQLVFGDGDGRVFNRFTKPIDVFAHELSHAVIHHTAAFVYQGQPGALNESVSDVFASCVKQRVLGQSAAEADWLIGAGIFMPSVNGRALRSMSEPGTAYDDPVLGRDPQVGHLDAYVETQDDNGGVHLNSGIPNRAFYLVATRLGGASWEQAGPIWYAALIYGLGEKTDFATFARATLDAAQGVSPEAADVVAGAWADVGLPVASRGSGTGAAANADVGEGSSGAEGAEVLEVRRSGGFAGRVVSGQLALGDDPRTPEVEHLLSRIDFAEVRTSRPQPDRFVYSFVIGGHEITVAEQALTPELSQLAHLVLDS